MTPIASARLTMLNAAVPVTKAIGHIHAPFAHRRTEDVHVLDAAANLVPGQVLVSRTRGELTNLFIPGDYTHAAVYVGTRRATIHGREVEMPLVIEAVSPVVRAVTLSKFLLTKDRVLALTPLFADAVRMEYACFQAALNLGIPYDFVFLPSWGNLEKKRKAFYCAELAFEVYRAGGEMPFVPRETMGVATVTPQDFVNATKYWRVDWDSDKVDPSHSLAVDVDQFQVA